MFDRTAEAAGSCTSLDSWSGRKTDSLIGKRWGTGKTGWFEWPEQ